MYVQTVGSPGTIPTFPGKIGPVIGEHCLLHYTNILPTLQIKPCLIGVASFQSVLFDSIFVIEKVARNKYILFYLFLSAHYKSYCNGVVSLCLLYK